jgi:hypothetical protein
MHGHLLHGESDQSVIVSKYLTYSRNLMPIKESIIMFCRRFNEAIAIMQSIEN